MRTHAISPLLFLLAGSGCNVFIEPLGDYYPDRADPVFSALSSTTERGNAGGFEVTIQGSGFGKSADEVLVLLGNHNVEVLSVEEDAITFVTPSGPITGGAVDLLIATSTGYTLVEDAYTYEVGSLTAAADLYDGESAYILVQNAWTSCYGGMWDQSGSDLAGAGCEQIAYIGQTGIEGVSEWFRSAYPRIHTTSQGFISGYDINPDGWVFQDPFSMAFPSGFDDLRRRVGNFELRNPDWEGDRYCANLDRSDPWTESITTEGDCTDADDKQYDLGVMGFCEGREAGEGGTYEYRAEWPVNHNFFSTDDGTGAPDHFSTVGVVLDAPEVGISEQTLVLPGSLDVQSESGFRSNGGAWVLSEMASCPDEDGDGEALLDEDGIVLSWTPIPDDVDLLTSGVADVQSYVHVSVSFLNLGWFGGEGATLRASVVVPDVNLYDEVTGRSYVGIPNSVLYQMPTPQTSWSSENALTQQGSLGTFDSNASFLIIEVQRVADYRIETDTDNVIFSYSTSDFGFTPWKNPVLRGDGCKDCVDGDGDGWTDALDPDCESGVGVGDELNVTSDYSCNDGVDNDSDGLADADDPDCTSGFDGETNCGDGEDNDGDGWVDSLDQECDPEDPYAFEAGEDDPTYTCSDGLDNDGDGWVDAQDPGCESGLGMEDDGYLGTACNDGIDNDGHGDADAADPYCATVGGASESEEPTWISGCINGTDDDDDGFVDGLDPDCEYPYHKREYTTYFEEGDQVIVPACYDGLDNDGDGTVDAADTSCWNPSWGYLADGMWNDESTDHGHGCTDGLDGDGDGWTDGADPDCQPGSSDTLEELGFGSTKCNDGLDNDGDGLIDGDDSYCTKASGNYEG